MWFIGVEVEQETSAPPPKKILDPPLNSLYDLVSDNMVTIDVIFLIARWRSLQDTAFASK